MAHASDQKADVSDVTEQIETIKSDIAALTARVGDVAAQKSADAKATATDAASKLKSAAADQAVMAQVRAAELGDSVRTAAEDGYASTEDAIRQQPILAMGIAAGVGFLIGLLATRRT